MKSNIIQNKSFEFAIRIVETSREIQNSKKEYLISKQLLRSGTAIGALVSEAEHAESTKDFIHKLSIGLKEANETRYWLRIANRANYIDKGNFDVLFKENNEIIKLLAAIVKTTKRKMYQDD